MPTNSLTLLSCAAAIATVMATVSTTADAANIIAASSARQAKPQAGDVFVKSDAKSLSSPPPRFGRGDAHARKARLDRAKAVSNFQYAHLTPADIAFNKGIRSGSALSSSSSPLNFDALKHNSKHTNIGGGQCVHPAPPRGWDSFNPFPIPVVFDEAMLMEQARLLSSNYGPSTGGAYNYVIIDEGWAEIGIGQWMLDQYGRPIPNTFLFPSSATTGGFAPLSATLQQQFNLSLGLWMIKGIPKMAVDMAMPIKGTNYTAADIAIKNKGCSWHWDVWDINMTHPGGQAYYDSIADLYLREWGVKYLKIDCIFGTVDYDAPEALGFARSKSSWAAR